MLAFCKHRYAPTLRHFSRTYRTSARAIMDVFSIARLRFKLTYCPTAEQKGDGFTKPLARAPFDAFVATIGISAAQGGQEGTAQPTQDSEPSRGKKKIKREARKQEAEAAAVARQRLAESDLLDPPSVSLALCVVSLPTQTTPSTS